MGQSLAVKYRPTVFEDVVEQTTTVTILKRVLETKNFKNCYLFSGKTGSGKTTCARLFAKAINQGVGDPIELDCASNGGVDNVRAIIDSANQRSLMGEYKIFILDECHAITSAGWQAFLKGIEETPKYTIFIFCTTEPNKVPATVLNRMQRYNFSAISNSGIRDRLIKVCQAEGFINYNETCDLISKMVQGSMRDALTYLEQCADYSTDLSLNNSKNVLGNLSYETMFKLTWALNSGEEGKVLATIDDLYNSGADLKNFVNSYLEFVLDLIKYITFKDIVLTNIPAYLATEENAVVQYTVEIPDALNRFNEFAKSLLDLKAAIKYDSSYKSTIEASLIRLMR